MTQTKQPPANPARFRPPVDPGSLSPEEAPHENSWMSWDTVATNNDEVHFFNVYGKHLAPWLWQSKGHHFAALALWEAAEAAPARDGRTFYHRHIALMLARLALETLIKMVIVADHVACADFPGRSTRLQDFLIKSHDLMHLAATAALKIDDAGGAVLRELTEYVEWRGKYPVPLRAEGYIAPAFLTYIDGTGTLKLRDLWTAYCALREALHRQAETNVESITAQH